MNESKDQKTFSFATCDYAHTSPDQKELSPKTKVLNIVIPFEEALKLDLGINECVRKLNKYKRSTTTGKRAALNLCIHLNSGRISINEGKLKK